MVVGELVRAETVHPGRCGPPTPAAAPTRDVVLLLSDVAHRRQVIGALEAAGYRVDIPRHPVAWVSARRSVILVTDDTEGAGRIREHAVTVVPRIPCVVLVDEPAPARYRQLLAAGTTALPASCAAEDVVLAVWAASRDLACVPVAVAQSLAGAEGDRPVLSEREVSWLRALVDGATVASLARAVGYSPREMYRVLGNLYARLGAVNRTEALLRADRWGLLAPPAPPASGSSAKVPAQRRPTP